MNLSNITPGNLFTRDDDTSSDPEVFMRGAQTEPGLFNTHRIYPATGLFEYAGGEQVTEVTVLRIETEDV